jgi:hypothetical protein
MEKITTSQSRRSFLKSSILAGGGLMISFSGLAKLVADGKINPTDLPEEWTELTGYIKDNLGQYYQDTQSKSGVWTKCNDLAPDDCRGRIRR